MKHIQFVSNPQVSRAQSSTGDILTIIGTVLSSIGALLLTVGPLIGKR